jgi:DNA-binding transcriptional MerR regulator
MDGQDDLLTVGRFARLARLTPKAVRHYDRVGLLVPAVVDPANGYRRYRPDQVPTARLIAQLRRLDLPLDEVRRLLPLADDPDAFGAALAAHRRRLDAHLVRARRILHELDHLIKGEPMSTTDDAVPADTRKRIAVDLFNHTWTLLEKPERSADDDAEMIHSAHASTCLWSQVGAPVNRARGEWQCSRVYATLGRPEPALYHARRCHQITEEHGIGDFDIAFAYEALARAYAVAGDGDEARRWRALAVEACAAVAEDVDREIVQADIDSLPAITREGAAARD